MFPDQRGYAQRAFKSLSLKLRPKCIYTHTEVAECRGRWIYLHKVEGA